MTHDKVLDKIRKMLALANNAGATDGERANALSQAHKWIAKHNIDMAAVQAGLNADGSLTATMPEEARVRVDSEFFGEVWTRPMCNAIADLFFCKYVYCGLGPNTGNIIHTFIGRESNATTAEIICKYVVQSIYKEGMAYMRGMLDRTGYKGHYSDYRAFARGASLRVIERAMHMKRDADKTMREEHGSTGTALVLADYYRSEQEKNAQMLGKVRVVKQRSGKVRNQTAIDHGSQFGSNVSLAPQVSGSKQGQLPKV